VNYPPPKPEVILMNFFAEPTVLLVPITSRVLQTTREEPNIVFILIGQHNKQRRWATRTSLKNRKWTHVLTKG